jgi:polyisoprenoid-binding protein YceI
MPRPARAGRRAFRSAAAISPSKSSRPAGRLPCTPPSTLDRFDGSYDVGADGTTIELTIDADSLDTGHPTRDKHLRSTDFFHVVEHPQVRFTSTRVHHVTSEILHVVGHLEAAGKVMQLEFAATVRQLDYDALEIEATTTLDQRELGMSTGQLGMIRPPATLHVKARVTR